MCCILQNTGSHGSCSQGVSVSSLKVTGSPQKSCTLKNLNPADDLTIVFKECAIYFSYQPHHDSKDYSQQPGTIDRTGRGNTRHKTEGGRGDRAALTSRH